ncbi:MAG: DUF2493 domain-containing protein [Defluviitaleaceae bacterium]|nr:DUF2493 domain-containing protein [Defluviitaleaceae bacterium]
MKIAIIGSRSLTDYDSHAILRYIPKNVTAIISGGAKGIDAWAERFAQDRGLRFIEILPDYQKYGKKAPIFRNREIVRQADLVLAIWDFKSRGTANAIVACIKEGVPVRILSGKPPSAFRRSRLIKF